MTAAEVLQSHKLKPVVPGSEAEAVLIKFENYAKYRYELGRCISHMTGLSASESLDLALLGAYHELDPAERAVFNQQIAPSPTAAAGFALRAMEFELELEQEAAEKEAMARAEAERNSQSRHAAQQSIAPARPSPATTYEQFTAPPVVPFQVQQAPWHPTDLQTESCCNRTCASIGSHPKILGAVIGSVVGVGAGSAYLLLKHFNKF